MSFGQVIGLFFAFVVGACFALMIENARHHAYIKRFKATARGREQGLRAQNDGLVNQIQKLEEQLKTAQDHLRVFSERRSLQVMLQTGDRKYTKESSTAPCNGPVPTDRDLLFRTTATGFQDTQIQE